MHDEVEPKLSFIKALQMGYFQKPEVYSAAASAIMYMTILTRAKLRANNIKHLPERLLALSKDAEQHQARIHSIKAEGDVDGIT